MSINSLTNEEIVLLNRSTRAAAQRAALASDAPLTDGGATGTTVTPPATPPPNSDDVKDNPVNNALNALIRYIPTEVLTLYLAAVAVAPSASPRYLSVDKLYVFFGFLTPVLFVLVHLSKLKSEGKKLPTVQGWPWFKIIASCIAFFVWALAVPGNPVTSGNPGAAGLAGLGALLISTLLTLIEPFFLSRANWDD